MGQGYSLAYACSILFLLALFILFLFLNMLVLYSPCIEAST